MLKARKLFISIAFFLASAPQSVWAFDDLSGTYCQATVKYGPARALAKDIWVAWEDSTTLIVEKTEQADTYRFDFARGASQSGHTCYGKGIAVQQNDTTLAAEFVWDLPEFFCRAEISIRDDGTLVLGKFENPECVSGCGHYAKFGGQIVKRLAVQAQNRKDNPCGILRANGRDPRTNKLGLIELGPERPEDIRRELGLMPDEEVKLQLGRPPEYGDQE